MTDSPNKLYRRRIIAVARDFETVAAMEDDFHFFTVRVSHDGDRVTDIVAESVRYPWTSCPGAMDRLKEMVGTKLRPEAGDAKPRLDMSQHCTHLFDLARFAITQTARGGRRQYDVTIPDRIGGKTVAEVSRDGALVFRWHVDGMLVTAPPAFAGHSLAGRAIWPEGSIADDDALEAALILRRALVIFRGRMPDYANITHAHEVPGAFGTCFTYQPENASSGRWVMEERDFRERPEAVLADFEARFGVGVRTAGSP